MKRAAVPLILFLFGFLLGLLCLVPMSSRPPDTAPVLSVQGSGGEDGGEVPTFPPRTPPPCCAPPPAWRRP